MTTLSLYILAFVFIHMENVFIPKKKLNLFCDKVKENFSFVGHNKAHIYISGRAWYLWWQNTTFIFPLSYYVPLISNWQFSNEV